MQPQHKLLNQPLNAPCWWAAVSYVRTDLRQIRQRLECCSGLPLHALWMQRCLSGAVRGPDFYCKRLQFCKFSLLTGSRFMINNFTKCCARLLECCMAYVQQPASSHTGNGSSASEFQRLKSRKDCVTVICLKTPITLLSPSSDRSGKTATSCWREK